MDERKGFVSLVGAGPGDAGLLTLKGRARIEQADVIVYDYLANPRLLQFAQADAEKIYAGKKAAAHSMTQEQINDLLVELAQAGKRVVRLKGGDPFVFGRGGEECEALATAGIEFEVVPGITAALAGPAYAGIPVTHRDFNSSFTFITGHEKESAYQESEAQSRDKAAGSSDIDWASLAKLPCIAFYMGVKSLPRITAKLIEHGMDPQTPAAAIQWGTRPNQRTIVATLATLAEQVEADKLGAPAITIIGRVVELRASMNWFETRPLFGQTIIVTRTRHQAGELSERLEELGARVIEAPTIELHPPADSSAVDQALLDIEKGKYDWVIFTSVNGVIETRNALLGLEMDGRSFSKVRVAAIGQATADALRKHLFLHPDYVPVRAVAEALADEWEDAGEVAGKRFILLRADIGRPVLIERLEAGGATKVSDVAVYETRPAEFLPDEVLDALRAGEVDWITFTSSSTARNFVGLLSKEDQERLGSIKTASIGPITSQTLREMAFQPTVEPIKSTVPALVSAIHYSLIGGDR